MSIRLKDSFNSLEPMPEPLWEEFEQFCTSKTLQKGDFLWKQGDVCKHLVFLEKGIIRIWDIDERTGREHSLEFFIDEKLFTDYYSFITQKPCNQNYEVIEDCQLTVIPRAAVYNLMDKHKYFERMGRLFAEANFLIVLDSLVFFKTSTPEISYLKLLENRPELLHRIPLRQIASFLNMTPEHLSRIRKKIIKN